MRVMVCCLACRLPIRYFRATGARPVVRCAVENAKMKKNILWDFWKVEVRMG